MGKKVKKIPQNYHSITPALAIKDAAKALDFYKKIFGAKVLAKLIGSSNEVVHSELKIGDSIIMISEENPQFNQSPVTLGGNSIILHLYVEDVDKTAKKAVAAGCKILVPAADQFYGDRAGRIEDPYGYIWAIATHIEDVPTKEMQKRFKKMLT